MSAELAIEKLRRMQQKLPADETGYELAMLLAAMEGTRQADAELRAAAQGAQQPAQQHWGMDGADRNPELFKGLVHLVCAVVPGQSILFAAQLSGGLYQLVQAESLRPILQPSGPAGQGMWSLHLPEQRPGAPPMSSISFLQMLVAGMLLSASTEAGQPSPERADFAAHCMNEAMEAAWPSSTDVGGLAAEQHLAARSWVPDLQLKAAPEWDAGPLSPTAAALQRDVRRHTPEVSLTELRCLGLLLRHSRIDAAPAPATAAQRALDQAICMADCQQALALSSGAAPGSMMERIHRMACIEAVMVAATAGEPAVCGTGAACQARRAEWMRLADELLQSCLAAKCWMAANGFARSLASLYWGMAQQIPARGTHLADFLAAQLLRKAEQLLDTARSCLPHLRRWLPQLQLQSYEQYQQHYEQGLADAKQGLPRRPTAPACEAVYATAPRCTQCGGFAPHLRKCSRCKAVAYCSRECQVKHWKEGGHKAECGRLAAQQGS